MLILGFHFLKDLGMGKKGLEVYILSPVLLPTPCSDILTLTTSILLMKVVEQIPLALLIHWLIGCSST